MYSSEAFKPKDNNFDINNLKQEISVLSDNFCRFKLLLKSYDKYFDYFNEILNTIEYYNKDLDLVNKFKSLNDIKTNIKVLKECEKSCFVCLEKLNENQFNQGIDCDINAETLNIDTIVYFENKSIKKKKIKSESNSKTKRKRKFTSISVESEDKECTDCSDPDFELNGEQNSSDSENDLSGQMCMNGDSTQKGYGCKVKGCDFIAKTRIRLTQHKRRMHSNKEGVFVCQHIGCGKQFSFSKYLKRHQKIHNIDPNIQFKCEWKDCTQVFNQKDYLNVHMQRHLKVKIFFCTHKGCQYSAKTAAELSGHQISHSNDRPFICLITDCKKQFKREAQLRNHQVRAHPQEFDHIPWLECSKTDCNFKTKFRRAMRDHDNVHNRPYVCIECKKRFSTICYLKAHIISHSPELSFRCDWPGCDRRFNRKERLAQHMNFHTLETTYSCDWPNCDKTYASKESLYCHVYQTHQRRRKYKSTKKS